VRNGADRVAPAARFRAAPRRAARSGGSGIALPARHRVPAIPPVARWLPIA